MPTYTPTPVTPGATSDANADVNNEFTALANILNGALDASNLANLAVTLGKMAANSVDSSKIVDGSIVNADVNAAAAIAYAKLNLAASIVNADVATAAAILVSKLAAGTDGQTLRTVGGTPTWGGSAQDVAASAVDVFNTTTETAIYSEVIPANLLGTSGMLRLTLVGDYLNDSAGGRAFVFRVKFGGTTIYDDQSAAFGATPTRKPWRCELVLANLGAANAQHLSGDFRMNTIGSAATAGLGPFDVGGGSMDINTVFSSAAINPAIDTTSAQTLEVTVQHLSAAVAQSIRKKYAALELVTP